MRDQGNKSNQENSQPDFKIFEEIRYWYYRLVSGYSQYKIRDSRLTQIRADIDHFIFMVVQAESAKAAFEASQFDAQGDEKKQDQPFRQSFNHENARFVWEELQSYPYRLGLATGLNEKTQLEVGRAASSVQKMSAILGSVNLDNGEERSHLWLHFKADNGYFLRRAIEQLGFPVPQKEESSFHWMLNQVLVTPQYREEFAEACPTLASLVRNKDFINPLKLNKKFLHYFDQGVEKFSLEAKELTRYQTNITNQLKEKPYYAGQYWMQYRDDEDRFTVLFTEKQQARLLAQVNLQDSRDRKKFYNYLARKNNKEKSLFDLLKENGGLYGHQASSVWSGLAAILRQVLSSPELAREFFEEQATLARALKLDDVYISHVENPHLLEIIKNTKRSFLEKRSLYEWQFGIENGTMSQSGKPKQSLALTPREALKIKEKKPGKLECILQGDNKNLREKIIAHLQDKGNFDLLESLENKTLFDSFISEPRLRSRIVTENLLLSRITNFLQEQDLFAAAEPGINNHRQFLAIWVQESEDSALKRAIDFTQLYGFNQDSLPNYTKALIDDEKITVVREKLFEYSMKEEKYYKLIEYASRERINFFRKKIADHMVEIVKKPIWQKMVVEQKQESDSKEEIPDCSQQDLNFISAILQSEIISQVFTISRGKLDVDFPLTVFETLKVDDARHIFLHLCRQYSNVAKLLFAKTQPISLLELFIKSPDLQQIIRGTQLLQDIIRKSLLQLDKNSLYLPQIMGFLTRLLSTSRSEPATTHSAHEFFLASCLDCSLEYLDGKILCQLYNLPNYKKVINNYFNQHPNQLLKIALSVPVNPDLYTLVKTILTQDIYPDITDYVPKIIHDVFCTPDLILNDFSKPIVDWLEKINSSILVGSEQKLSDQKAVTASHSPIETIAILIEKGGLQVQAIADKIKNNENLLTKLLTSLKGEKLESLNKNKDFLKILQEREDRIKEQRKEPTSPRIQNREESSEDEKANASVIARRALISASLTGDKSQISMESKLKNTIGLIKTSPTVAKDHVENIIKQENEGLRSQCYSYESYGLEFLDAFFVAIKIYSLEEQSKAELVGR